MPSARNPLSRPAWPAPPLPIRSPRLRFAGVLHRSGPPRTQGPGATPGTRPCFCSGSGSAQGFLRVGVVLRRGRRWTLAGCAGPGTPTGEPLHGLAREGRAVGGWRLEAGGGRWEERDRRTCVGGQVCDRPRAPAGPAALSCPGREGRPGGFEGPAAPARGTAEGGRPRAQGDPEERATFQSRRGGVREVLRGGKARTTAAGEVGPRTVGGALKCARSGSRRGPGWRDRVRLGSDVKGFLQGRCVCGMCVRV